ncbi:hypothetical protein [Micromonospora peucetia]|uniref:DUF3558 domain-containing protein n=1 Tax=Micromonospora peucetia TaxID=47871 RepID=A0ABZ1EG56_9ACTN|nr:hypothetical protein [Micromonospora peucetia]WSA32628.1 hypothetical protein OIE14_00560 [Micromonospora peucetia]
MRLRACMVLVVCVLSVGATGCGAGPAAPAALRDPCELINDEVLDRLAPGSARKPRAQLGDISGSRACDVDLTAGTASMRGDLEITVAVDGSEMYDDGWRAKQCAKIGAKLTSSGPGDASCLVTTPWTGGQARIDGRAWVGGDYEVSVTYQLVAPRSFPPGAEQDLRDLLAAGVDSLPVG